MHGRSRELSVFIGLSLLVPVFAFAQHALENPQPNSNQSGISAITGWICNGQNPAIRFNGGAVVPVAYGTSRGDTVPICGDDNNGFSLLWNWNLLGDGQHFVELVNGGVVIASASVRVTTMGSEFLQGQSSTTTATIAGRQVTLQWAEAAQNFMITGVTSGTVPTVAGRWSFRLNYVSEDCNFLSVPPDLPTSVNSTLTFTQNGTQLTAVEVTLVLTGTLEPDGDFLVISEPDISNVPGCSYAIAAGLGGNFLTGAATLSYTAVQLSGACLGVSLPCAVNYAGSMTKVSGFAQSTPSQGGISELRSEIPALVPGFLVD